jgi:hypothetical protein
MITRDSSAIYTDRTAYDFIENSPRLTYIGVEDTVKKYNFMGSAKADSNNWVSLRSYDLLMKTLVPTTNHFFEKSNLSNDIIEISGIITKDDEGYFHPFLLSNTGNNTPSSSGPYLIEIKDNSGNVINSRSLDIPFIRLSDPPKETDEAFFSARLERSEEANKVVLLKDNTIIAEQILSPNAPILTITEPASGETITSGTNLKWTASDEDGDELSYTIFFDKGNNDIISIATNIKNNSVIIDNNLIRNAQGTLTVIATDGFNYGTDSLSNLTIVGNKDLKQGSLINKYYLDQNYPKPYLIFVFGLNGLG